MKTTYTFDKLKNRKSLPWMQSLKQCSYVYSSYLCKITSFCCWAPSRSSTPTESRGRRTPNNTSSPFPILGSSRINFCRKLGRHLRHQVLDTFAYLTSSLPRQEILLPILLLSLFCVRLLGLLGSFLWRLLLLKCWLCLGGFFFWSFFLLGRLLNWLLLLDCFLLGLFLRVRFLLFHLFGFWVIFGLLLLLAH